MILINFYRAYFLSFGEYLLAIYRPDMTRKVKANYKLENHVRRRPNEQHETIIRMRRI